MTLKLKACSLPTMWLVSSTSPVNVIYPEAKLNPQGEIVRSSVKVKSPSSTVVARLPSESSQSRIAFHPNK